MIFRWESGHRLTGEHRGILSEELPVSEGNTTRAVHTYHILVKLSYFHHDTGLIPFCGVWACLVLYVY